MEKKQISPVVIVSLLIVGLSLLTAGILLYSERVSRETEELESTPEAVTETSVPAPILDFDAEDQGPVEVEGLSEDSLLETTPVTDETGEVDIDTQIRAIEEELNAIDEELYNEGDISDSSLNL